MRRKYANKLTFLTADDFVHNINHDPAVWYGLRKVTLSIVKNYFLQVGSTKSAVEKPLAYINQEN